ncbi:MAG: lipoyl(octanoyl) transferase LipB [Woeseiaceae bacterium]|jgi:lipoyl(octanoyl) transferase|nr:lipoyl(octanoyl) transferase LipB [Woeseiaceae bacterium]
MIIVRSLGREDYEPLWRRMQSFTNSRGASTPDEIWFTEHPPVFTLGLNASREHLLDAGDIPVVQVDRGGQVTYHGPGQLMIYPLIDLKRSRIGVRDLVTGLEQSIVDLVAEYDIDAMARKDAPGVYVESKKIASVGLRIRRGSSFHGMALNLDVDLATFSRINPCGFSDLEVTDLAALGIPANREVIRTTVEKNLLGHLGLQNESIVRLD